MSNWDVNSCSACLCSFLNQGADFFRFETVRVRFFVSDLIFYIQADIRSVKVYFVGEFEPLNRFVMSGHNDSYL